MSDNLEQRNPESYVERQLKKLLLSDDIATAKATIHSNISVFIEQGILAASIGPEIERLLDTREPGYYDKCLALLAPIIDLERKDYDRFFSLVRLRQANEEQRHLSLNELVRYERVRENDEEYFQLHIADNRDLDLSKFRPFIQNALQQLAILAEKEKNIHGLVGTSWIIARIPRLMQQLGFVDEGLVANKVVPYFPDKPAMAIHKAKMSRERLLEYLPANQIAKSLGVLKE